jgi:hypothetical protein
MKNKTMNVPGSLDSNFSELSYLYEANVPSQYSNMYNYICVCSILHAKFREGYSNTLYRYCNIEVKIS